MKLVDILASELKHWPSTRTAAVGQSNSGSLHLNEEPRHGSEFFGWTTCKFTMAEDCQSAWVTRAEWQAAVDALNAPKVVEWDGVGSPPAGSTCQIRHSGWDAGSWQTADIKYISSEYLIIGHGNFKREQHFHMPDIQFRPVRTAEQVAAEEREKAIADLYFTINWNEGRETWPFISNGRKADYEKAIDAGYTKVAK